MTDFCSANFSKTIIGNTPAIMYSAKFDSLASSNSYDEKQSKGCSFSPCRHFLHSLMVSRTFFIFYTRQRMKRGFHVKLREFFMGRGRGFSKRMFQREEGDFWVFLAENKNVTLRGFFCSR